MVLIDAEIPDPGGHHRVVLLRASTLMSVTAAWVVASTIGTALLAGLLPNYPAVLLSLSPGNAALLLVARRIPFWAYLGIGVSRLVVSDVAPFLLGYLHGRRGLNLVVKKERQRKLIDDQARNLRPVALAGSFVSASAVISAVAGFTRIRPSLFLLLDSMGSTARLFLLWWLAGRFSSELEMVSDQINVYQRNLVIGGIALGALLLTRGRRSGTRQRS